MQFAMFIELGIDVKSIQFSENEALMEGMICSQEDQPGTHVPPSEIAKELGLYESSVREIVKRNP